MYKTSRHIKLENLAKEFEELGEMSSGMMKLVIEIRKVKECGLNIKSNQNIKTLCKNLSNSNDFSRLFRMIYKYGSSEK